MTLAHRGVLFLDELPEFNRPALEALRLPLQDGEVRSRAPPARCGCRRDCLVVAAMNPCPCGLHGDPRPRVLLHAAAAGRLPIAGERPAGSTGSICGCTCRGPTPTAKLGEPSAAVAGRVSAAQEVLVSGAAARRARAERLLADAMRSAAPVGTGSRRGWRVASTIAALDGRERVGEDDVAEALAYRGQLR